jgi:acyl carrier protein
VTPEEADTAVRTALHEVAPDVDPDTLPADADLRDELGLDSLDFLRLVELLSDRTHLRIEEDDYAKLSTLASATAWLSTR